MNRIYYPSPAGLLCIESGQDAVTALYLADNSAAQKFPAQPETPLLAEVRRQLTGYFNRQLKTFDIPLALSGTMFQLKVWETLRQIPYGETRSYADVAAAAGNPRACRAVGGANHRNPIMILVPCHRVIGKNGSLTGFGGGINVKQFLLNLERGM